MANALFCSRSPWDSYSDATSEKGREKENRIIPYGWLFFVKHYIDYLLLLLMLLLLKLRLFNANCCALCFSHATHHFSASIENVCCGFTISRTHRHMYTAEAAAIYTNTESRAKKRCEKCDNGSCSLHWGKTMEMFHHTRNVEILQAHSHNPTFHSVLFRIVASVAQFTAQYVCVCLCFDPCTLWMTLWMCVCSSVYLRLGEEKFVLPKEFFIYFKVDSSAFFAPLTFAILIISLSSYQTYTRIHLIDA